MSRIVSLTGPSAAGKTMLASKLLTSLPEARMVTSYTTRKKRPSDLPGEYKYLSTAEFSAMHDRGAFLWTAIYDTGCYGTTPESIVAALKDPKTLGVMILLPSTIPLLVRFLHAIDEMKAYTPIFVSPPPPSVLEERLRARGDSEESIRKRLAADRDWLEQSIHSYMHYEYIDNDGDINDALVELLRAIRA